MEWLGIGQTTKYLQYLHIRNENPPMALIFFNVGHLPRPLGVFGGGIKGFGGSHQETQASGKDDRRVSHRARIFAALDVALWLQEVAVPRDLIQ